MRIVRFKKEDGTICFGTNMADGTAEVLEGTPFKKMKTTGEKAGISKLLAPVHPTAILCIGLNYKAHAQETGMQLPQYPVLFMKNPASIISHEDSIVIPRSCLEPPQVDYEIELAVIIGKKAKNVPASKAFDYIAGYTIANDVSARTWQNKAGGKQWVRGKSFDSFCPLGPEWVTTDEVADPNKLDLTCCLNGEIMQQANTSDMIFPVSKLIEYLSEDTTLLPGTVILSGTPSGVGFTRNPPIFLKPGDEIEMQIELLGTLKNQVIAGKANI